MTQTMLSNPTNLLCPFRKFKSCDVKCAFYRKGVRFDEKTEITTPVEACAINIIADNLEQMHNKTYMMQKEVGQVKDAVIMQTLVGVDILQKKRVSEEMLKIANSNIIDMQEPTKLIE